MKTAEHRNPLKTLTECAVPSLFRHDLREPIIFRREAESRGDRTSESEQRRLARVIDLLSEGHPVHMGDYPHGAYRRVLLLSSSGPSGELKAGATGSIAVATRYVDGVERSFFSLDSLTLVFFPSPRHVGKYYEAGAYSMANGPADTFPGSVGMLRLLYDSSRNLAQLTELQSSVNFENKRVVELLKTPHNNLSGFYFRWRHHLLEQAFCFVRDMGISRLAIGPVEEDPFPLNYRVKNYKLIVEKALKSNFALSRDGSVLQDLS